MVQNGLNKIHIKDYDLDFIKWGHGNKNLIMIPGLSYIMIPAQVERRKKFSEVYADEFTCFYPERKPNLPYGYTTEQMAEDVFDFICALGLKEVFVQGFSQGGMIGQWLAINHPEIVKALVLTVTLYKPNDMIKQTLVWANEIEEGKPYDALQRMQNDSYSNIWLDVHKDDEIELPPQNARRPADQYKIMAKACTSHNAFNRLSEIKCPVLINGGWNDKVVSGEASIEMSLALKCDTVMYEKLGHGLYEEDLIYHERVFSWLKTHAN